MPYIGSNDLVGAYFAGGERMHGIVYGCPRYAGAYRLAEERDILLLVHGNDLEMSQNFRIDHQFHGRWLFSAGSG